jgi:hypothetical protein
MEIQVYSNKGPGPLKGEIIIKMHHFLKFLLENHWTRELRFS